MYLVAYDEDWWIPDRLGFTQRVCQRLDTRQSLLVTLACTRHLPQPTVQDAGIYEACEHLDGPYWTFVETVASDAITLTSASAPKLLERALGEAVRMSAS